MNAEKMNVTVGVCGGVAAYKAVELVRLLQEAGLDPHVVMTEAAGEFVGPLTFDQRHSRLLACAAPETSEPSLSNACSESILP